MVYAPQRKFHQRLLRRPSFQIHHKKATSLFPLISLVAQMWLLPKINFGKPSISLPKIVVSLILRGITGGKVARAFCAYNSGRFYSNGIRTSTKNQTKPRTPYQNGSSKIILGPNGWTKHSTTNIRMSTTLRVDFEIPSPRINREEMLRVVFCRRKTRECDTLSINEGNLSLRSESWDVSERTIATNWCSWVMKRIYCSGQRFPASRKMYELFTCHGHVWMMNLCKLRNVSKMKGVFSLPESWITLKASLLWTGSSNDSNYPISPTSSPSIWNWWVEAWILFNTSLKANI